MVRVWGLLSVQTSGETVQSGSGGVTRGLEIRLEFGL